MCKNHDLNGDHHYHKKTRHDPKQELQVHMAHVYRLKDGNHCRDARQQDVADGGVDEAFEVLLFFLQNIIYKEKDVYGNRYLQKEKYCRHYHIAGPADIEEAVQELGSDFLTLLIITFNTILILNKARHDGAAPARAIHYKVSAIKNKQNYRAPACYHRFMKENDVRINIRICACVCC